MRIRVNQGTLSKRYSSTLSKDEFVFLFPGIYEAELILGNELILQKNGHQKTFLPIHLVEEKITRGIITFLDVDK
jgi:hypothetical protein